MANTYFRFKLFTIHQDRCAMKVGTDGVLLGAWANVASASKILDIGTGTGIIALMLAQRSEAYIEAIEIETDAAQQADENFTLSPWKHRLKIHNTALNEYLLMGNYFDYIVSNPPFFSEALLALNPQRAKARHNFFLSQTELLFAVQQLLTKNGVFGIILPPNEFNKFKFNAETFGLWPIRITNIFGTSGKPIKRVLAEFSKNKGEPQIDELIIEMEGRHNYSLQFIELTSGFYLKH